MTGNRWQLFILSLLAFYSASTVYAYDEPAVNLGYTSFFDGGPPAGPGAYYQNYFQYYGANRLNDKNHNRLPLPRTDVDVTANIMQFIYLSQKKLFGANVGISALLPWVVDAHADDGLNHAVLDGLAGPGDLFIGPALQFDPIMHSDGKSPFYVQRLELDFVAPLGQYNGNYAVNPSSHFWSLNPYWAATVWFNQKWSASWRLHYLWNAKNGSPNAAFGPYVYNTQAGQAIFANIAGSYQVQEQLFVGVNAYVLNQITPTKANGYNVPGREERVWAIGPGVLYSISKNHFIFFNLYCEQHAANRPQGTNSILRYVIHF